MATMANRGSNRSGLKHHKLAELARAYPISSFFVTAYGLSWAYWVVALGLFDHTSVLWYLPGGYGVATAGLLVAGALNGRAGVRVYLRRIVLWRVHLRWYLAALLGPPALILAGVVAASPGTDLPEITPSIVVSYLVALLLGLVLGAGLAEEPGWRGFALPRLQERLGPLRGTVWLALLWTLWHLPLYFLVPGFNGAGSGAGVAVPFLAFACYVVAFSLLLTWLFNHTKGSVLLAMLAHVSLNTSGSLLESLTSAPQGTGPILMVLLVAAIITVATHGKLGYQPREG